MIRLSIVGLYLVGLVISGCAGGLVTTFTLHDLRAGQTRADAAGDAVWAACYQALADDLDARAKASVGGPPAGLFDAAMAAHLLYVRGQTGVPDAVKLKCSPVAMEILIFMARVGLKVGGLPIGP